MAERFRVEARGPHWSEVELAALAAGLRPSGEASRGLEIASHFYSCRACRKRLLPYVSYRHAPRPRGGDDTYEFVLRRWERNACALEKQYAETRARARTEIQSTSLVGRLGDFVDHALAEPKAEPILQFARAEALLAQARKLRREDPKAAIFYAQSALNFTAHLLAETFPRGAVADLRAEVAAELANLFRIAGDFAEAEAAFSEAFAAWDAGTQDPQLLTRCGALLASQLIDNRAYIAGEALIRRTVAGWRKLGNRHEEGRELVTLGLHLGYFRSPESAIPILLAAVEKIDIVREPALALSAHQLLIRFFSDLGDAETGWMLLKRAEPLFDAWGNEIDVLKKWWLEGCLQIERNELWRADEKLTAAERGFDRKKLPYQKALVQLDLVALHLTRSKFTLAREVVEEALATFRALGIAREALASVVLLAEAVRGETATVAQVRAAARVLSRR